MPQRATWDQVKQELLDVLGVVNSKDRAFDKLLCYNPGDKGLGEIAIDIMTEASRATSDLNLQHRLGLRAFLSAVPDRLGRELRRKHFSSVKEALEEAKFLQRVIDEESSREEKVLVVDKADLPLQKGKVEELLKHLVARGLVGRKRERLGKTKATCWCCGEQGHFVKQCPVVCKNKSSSGGNC